MHETRIKKNDRVIFSQLDLFDNSLLDASGTVIAVTSNPAHKEDPHVSVFFDELGLKTVDMSSLTKVN